MKPTLILKAPELRKYARKIADAIARAHGPGCCVVPRPAPNPTLVAHGLVKASLWHITTADPPIRAVADLYVGSKAEAARVTRLLANLLKSRTTGPMRLRLLDNTATPAELRGHPSTTVEANPSRSKAARARRRAARVVKKRGRTAAQRAHKLASHVRRGIAHARSMSESYERSRAFNGRRPNPKGRNPRPTTVREAVAQVLAEAKFPQLVKDVRSGKADPLAALQLARKFMNNERQRAIIDQAIRLVRKVPGANPSRSKAARRGRTAKRRAYGSSRARRAADARAREIRAGGTGKSELARFGRIIARRRTNPKGRKAHALYGGYLSKDGYIVLTRAQFGHVPKSAMAFLGDDIAVKVTSPVGVVWRPVRVENPKKGRLGRNPKRPVCGKLGKAYHDCLHGRKTGCQCVNPISRSIDKRSIRTIRRGGKSMLVGCPKGSYQPRKARCRVGTRRVNRKKGGARRTTRHTRRTHARVSNSVSRRRPNPASSEKAAQVVRMFEDRGPIKVKTRRVKAPKRLSGAVAKIGEAVAVVYGSKKFDGKSKDYEHKFKKPRPVFVVDPKSGDINLVRDKSNYSLTPDGIIN